MSLQEYREIENSPKTIRKAPILSENNALDSAVRAKNRRIIGQVV